MISYVLRRLLQAVVVTLLVSALAFIALHVLPGGLVRAQLGGRPTATAVHDLEVQEGLFKPLIVQYGVWVWNALHGNLGFSYQLNQPVGTLLGEFLPRTLLLVGTATGLAVIIAIPVGMFQAVRRNKVADHAITVSMLTFYSMPAFLLGVILIVVFGLWLNVFPTTAANYGASFHDDVADLILPVATLCLGNLSYFSRFMRSSAIDSMLSEYVKTARAKGASGYRVLAYHVLRNSFSSMLTLVGLTLPYVLSGSLIVEKLFDYPGMGLLFWNASNGRDFPVLLGVLLVVTVGTILGSLMADLGYAWLDPRVRYR